MGGYTPYVAGVDEVLHRQSAQYFFPWLPGHGQVDDRTERDASCPDAVLVFRLPSLWRPGELVLQGG